MSPIATQRIRESEAVKACGKRLRKTADLATPAELTQGLVWYTRAEQLAERLGEKFGLHKNVVAGILAVMSPSVSWDYQEEWTARWISAEQNGLEQTFPGYGANIEKARRILVGHNPFAVVKGPKVSEFWRAICGSTDAVCIDRHALRAALGTYTADGDLRNSMSAGERRTVVAAYKATAEKCGLNPREFQAVVWVVQRRLSGLTQERQA